MELQPGMTEADETRVEEDPFRESFEAFYRRERSALVGLAYVLSGSRSGAEDLAQDALIQAFKYWNRIGAYDDPNAWVRRVLANTAVSGFRRRTAEARALLRIGGESFVVPELTADAEELWSAVRGLPRRQAQTIALRYLDGRSISDIAHILQCSENTVNTHLKRAKQSLSNQLHEDLT